MKKVSLIVSLLVIATLLLAACGGDAGDQSQTPGADMTPGVEVTEMATEAGGDTGTDGDALATPTVGVEEVEPTATVAMEEEATPTVEAGAGDAAATPTVATGGAADETPQAGVPVTGDDCDPNRLTNVLDFVVVDAAGEQIGEVDKVIVLRDAKLATGDETVESGAVQAGGSSVEPQLAYVIVDLEENDNDVLVPFGAFDLQAVGTGDAAADAGAVETPAATDAAATPVAGDAAANTPVAGDTADDALLNGCLLTTTVDAQALAAAPVFEEDIDITVDNWDEEFRTYWSGQGQTIPATGSDTGLGSPVIFEDAFDDVNAINNEGEDIGEVEEFVVDPETGNLRYAILAAGGFLGLGETFIPVPMNQVQWIIDEANDADEYGHLVINISEENWQNAPSFNSPDEIDASVEGWDEDIQAFWTNLTTDTEAQPEATPTVSQ